MQIEVASSGKNTKDKGDLLEKFVKKFLEYQNHEVETEIRKTGMEIDLLCVNKSNRSKKLYIECKAYDPGTPVQASAVKNLVGIKELEDYPEAWLISTSGFGKDAKGLIEKIGLRKDSAQYTFYSPGELIECLTTSGKIVEPKTLYKSSLDGFDQKRIGDPILLISSYGDFWLFPYLEGGKNSAVIVVSGKDGSLTQENTLLNNISKLDTSLKGLDFLKFGLTSDDSEELVGSMRLKEEYLKQINSIGIRFTHPGKDELTLEDIFIYPDLEDLGTENSAQISSSKLATLQDGFEKAFIFGDDVSGKTSLAYSLQREFNEKGLLALYINAEEIKNSNLEKFLRVELNSLKEQYGDSPSQIKIYEDIVRKDNPDIVLILDNYERLGIKRSQAITDLLTILEKRYQKLFIFSNTTFELEAMAKSEMRDLLENFKKLRIKQCGHVLRDLLIDKWLGLSYGEEIPENDLLNKKDEIAGKIKVIVGTNFLPTYPLYLLTMLQLIEADNKNKLQGSSYAELYRYLINQALGAVNIKPDDLDFYHTYLSHLAYNFFSLQRKEVTQAEMIKIYEEYSLKMDIEKPFDTVHGLLDKAKILKNEHGSYSFNHNYGYYFFTAKYLAENISEIEIRNEITNLTNKLYRKEYANIIIFLIHHSKNKEIIQDIINESKKLFNNIVPAQLSDEEVSDINNLIQEEIRVSISDRSPQQHRREELEHQDRLEAAASKEPELTDSDEELENLDLFGKINLAFKLMEILGQIGKNYYGSLDANNKTQILEEVEGLGLRALRALLEDFQKYIESIRHEVEEVVDKKSSKSSKSIPQADRDQIANNIIYGFTEILVVIFLKRISDSVASKNLFITLDRIAEDTGSPATQLINLAARLNFPGEMKPSKILDQDSKFSGNHLLKRLLRFLVVEHLYRFDVPFSEKQSICASLGISAAQSKRQIQKKLSNS